MVAAAAVTQPRARSRAVRVLSHDLAIADRQQVHSDTLISAEDYGDYHPCNTADLNIKTLLVMV